MNATSPLTPLSDAFAERYSFDWVGDPDRTVPLYHGLLLMRNVVGIAWPETVIVNWASRDAPFHGRAKHSTPPEILIDPKPLLRRVPSNRALLVDVLMATVLHEGSHLAFTPETWPREVERLVAEHQQTTGRHLPADLMDILFNWAEDLFIEGQLCASLPGFRGYFENAWAFYVPPTDRRRRLQKVQRLLGQLRAGADKRAIADRFLTAVVDLILVAVRYPGDFEDPIRAVVPAVTEAAQKIRQAEGEADLARRLGYAIAAADRIFCYLLDVLELESHPSGAQPQLAPGGDDALRAARAGLARVVAGHLGRYAGGAGTASPPGVNPVPSREAAKRTELAERINRVVKARKPLLRDHGDPLNAQPATATIPHDVQRALASLEHGNAVFLPARAVATSPLEGPFTIRVIDSHPATLPEPPQGLDTFAEQLFTEYRLLAEDLRRRLRFRDTPIESIEYGQRQGDLDDYRLVDLVMGASDVFYRREQTPGRKVELTVLVDESGSMSQANRWKLAAAASICLEYAVRSLAGVRLRVFGFTGDVIKHETLVFRHYDSAVPRLRRPWALGYSYPKAYTPTGLALAAVRQELRQGRHAAEWRQALLLISDGQPQAAGYAFTIAVEHVAAEVGRLLHEGITFAALQIGLTVGDDQLTRMYGQRWRRVTRPEEIPSSIISLALTYLGPHQNGGLGR